MTYIFSNPRPHTPGDPCPIGADELLQARAIRNEPWSKVYRADDLPWTALMQYRRAYIAGQSYPHDGSAECPLPVGTLVDAVDRVGVGIWVSWRVEKLAWHNVRSFTPLAAAKCETCSGTGTHESPGYDSGEAECPQCEGEGTEQPAKEASAPDAGEAVAYWYQHPTESNSDPFGTIRLTDADKAAGWTETPLYAALTPADADAADPWPSSALFNMGDTVQKKGKAKWRGHIVGWYRTSITTIGYAIERANEPGSVQIYPETAIEAWLKENDRG